jgi:hypothetical protein
MLWPVLDGFLARPTSFGARARLPNDASLTFGPFFTLSQPTLRVIPSERHTMIDADLAAARIRSPFLAWAMLGCGAIQVILAALFFALLGREPLTYLVTYLAWFLLVIGSALMVEALWLRTCGVDLLPEHALVRGFRRRVVPWQQVQAVARRPQAGGWLVQLMLESGKPVMLRAPMISWGIGGKRGVVAYEQDYHRIEQWWLTHRGPSWHDVTKDGTSG